LNKLIVTIHTSKPVSLSVREAARSTGSRKS
jgi:hypothetical protein